MNSRDLRTLDLLYRATDGGRTLLRTLARRGKALERDEVTRGTLILAAVRTHPLYKGGRLAFDMLEIEDLILEGPPSEPMQEPDLRAILTSVGGGAGKVIDALLGRNDTPSPPSPHGSNGNDVVRVRFGPEDDATSGAETVRPPLPELVSSDYLFDLVVLGFLDVLGSVVHEAPERTSRERGRAGERSVARNGAQHRRAPITPEPSIADAEPRPGASA